MIPRCTEIHRKPIKEFESTGKMDQNHLKIQIMEREPSIMTKYTDFYPLFGQEVKARSSSEVPRCIEISRKATRDIQLTSKMYHNHLNYKFELSILTKYADF